ncbi:Iron-sulfur assembly protein 1 (Isa 1) [Leishmania donovani]|uniref:Iron-sulfur_assembly_protein_1_putative/GeneDB:Lm jF.16.0830 n=1 Tax=Leishmania donovani TaxID=5661 RepID=A0A6J8F817_LEIDO|nr:Iron-sulfur assembly protein 1 (Isa 1) [Leishmania donovani]VDZ43561.1 Iron-sulfur_assembly_protein_1_putative/GeneDB:LmjF.16.0830 [Leishmania donovani]
MQTSLLGRIGGAALCQKRLFQSTAAAGAGTTTAATVNSSRSSDSGANASASSDTSLHTQQLYKSVHKGRGTTPIPKSYKEPTLRSRVAPASGAGAVSSAAAAAETLPPPLVGARSSCAEDAGPVPQRALSPLQKRQLQFRNKAAFVLTPQALRRVKYLLAQYSTVHSAAAAKSPLNSDASDEVPSGIRIGVRRRGCSGYSYTVNYFFDSAQRSGKGATPSRKMAGLMEDLVVEQDGVKVVVDADAQFYVIGTEMDYVITNVEEKFTFKNPNQKYSCGCGESFMPYDADDMDTG